MYCTSVQHSEYGTCVHTFLLVNGLNLRGKCVTMSEKHLTDWSKCFICQKDNSEKLICPANANSESSGYESFVANLRKFEELGSIPLDIRLDIKSDMMKYADIFTNIPTVFLILKFIAFCLNQMFIQQLSFQA